MKLFILTLLALSFNLMAQELVLSELHCDATNGVELDGTLVAEDGSLEVVSDYYGLKKIFDAKLTTADFSEDRNAVITLTPRDGTNKYAIKLRLYPQFNEIQYSSGAIYFVTGGYMTGEISNIKCTMMVNRL